ncbi:MAG TPA: hypothetical protein VGJ87_23280, partial [Roseiflexaceae bacterium]
EARARQGTPSHTTIQAAHDAQQQLDGAIEKTPPRSGWGAYDRYAAAALGFIVGVIITGIYGARR